MFARLYARLYDWMLALARHPKATLALAIVSFCESSLFPIMPDIMLAPMILADRAKAWRLAFICTLASVLGALLGYLIGFALYDFIGQPIIAFYGGEAAFEKFTRFYTAWGFWIVFISAVSFIPFKIATIASGVLSMNPFIFIIACALGRAARFYGVAVLCATDPRAWLVRPIWRASFIWVASLIILASAFGFEYIGNFPACDLCLQQRWPYYAALILAPCAMWVAKGGSVRGADYLLGLIALAYLAGSGLAFYHAGIEWGFWAGPTNCAAGDFDINDISTQTLLESLPQSPIISCALAPWRLFGLSLAGYNFLASLALAALAAWPFYSKWLGIKLEDKIRG